MIDLDDYNLEEVVVAAIKSEIDSNAAYSNIADRVKNAFLKEKFRFLAGEEEKHKAHLEKIFEENFSGEELKIPDKSPVPLPEIKIYDENMNLSEVIESAMVAEKAAQDFYNEFANLFPAGSETRNTLHYFATMELSHYKILEIERDNCLNFESYDEYWPLMHVGP